MMEWKNLEDEMYPNCEGYLAEEEKAYDYYWLCQSCDFIISSSRMEEILEDMS